jgi:hypothetical protein
MADLIPVLTAYSNSAKLMPGGVSRMLTLAGPVGVVTWKSGSNASVVGEPVQADTTIETLNESIDKMRMTFTSLVNEMFFSS